MSPSLPFPFGVTNFVPKSFRFFLRRPNRGAEVLSRPNRSHTDPRVHVRLFAVGGALVETCPPRLRVRVIAVSLSRTRVSGRARGRVAVRFEARGKNTEWCVDRSKHVEHMCPYARAFQDGPKTG